MKGEVQRNLGATDRIIRTVVAVFLLFLALTKTATGLWALLAAGLGIFQIVEAAAAY